MREIIHCNILKFSPFYMAMMNVFIMFHVLICTSGLECLVSLFYVVINIVVVIYC